MDNPHQSVYSNYESYINTSRSGKEYSVQEPDD